MEILKKVGLVLLVKLVFFSSVYGYTVSDWKPFDNVLANANVTLFQDVELQKDVFSLNNISTSQSGGFKLDGLNIETNMLSWKMKYSENFIIYIGVNTTDGYKFLKYTSADSDGGLSSNQYYIHHGLGTNIKDGEWHTVHRDLQADLNQYIEGKTIVSIDEFRVIGSGLISDIISENTNLDVNITNGLVAHYEFEGNAKDSSGNGNDGTEHGGVSYANGVIGQAGSFDGVDDYVEVENHNLNILDTISISLWRKSNNNTTLFQWGESCPDGNSNYKGTTITMSISSYYESTYLRLSDTNRFNVSIFSENGNFYDPRIFSVSKEAFVEDKYEHLLFIFDKKVLTLYKNGKVISQYHGADKGASGNTQTITLDEFKKIFISKATLKIGVNESYCGNNHEFNRFLTGQIDDLRIYNRALNQAEIRELYKLGDSPDSDADGISDKQERELGLNPNSNDSDNDGILDLVEVGDINNPINTDGDKWIDALDEDSDGDGFTDKEEVKSGTDPQDRSSKPSGCPSTAITLEALKEKIKNNEDITKVNTCAITDMSGLCNINFYSFLTEEEENNLRNFNQDISGWDVSNVTNMSAMFSEVEVFNQPIGEWDVSNVTNMSWMFSGARAFNQPLGEWDVTNVTDMMAIFQGADSFNQPLGEWDVSNVTNMSWIFAVASAFNQPIGEWDVSSVTNMESMFFKASKFNQPIGKWDVSNVTSMNQMFDNAKLFNQSIEEWDVSNVTNMKFMFSETSTFNQPIGEWDVSNVMTHTNFSLRSILQDSYNPFVDDEVPVITLNGNVSSILTKDDIYTELGATATDNVDANVTVIISGSVDMTTVGTYTLTYTAVDNAGNVSSEERVVIVTPVIITGCDMSTVITIGTLKSMILENEDVTQVNTCAITDMSWLFANNTTFNQDISGWDVSNVTNMKFMFLDATNFNQNIKEWDVSGVTDMSFMFYLAISFNQPIGDWDVSSVTNMSNLFGSATSFNQPIGKWEISNVTDMNYMFYRARTFNQPIGDWDVSSVIDMSDLFGSARAFNQPIGDWNVANVTNMRGMFEHTRAFNQSIGDWDVSSVTNMRGMFYEVIVFNQPLNAWNVSSVSTHTNFNYHSALTSTNLPNFP